MVYNTDSDIQPLEQEKTISLTNLKNKSENKNQSKNENESNSVNNENNDIGEKIRSKLYKITGGDENISENEIENEDEIKTTIRKKNINIYDIDSDEKVNDNINEINLDTKFNISSDRLVCNEPKTMNYILCDKIKEMFSCDKTKNNVMHFIYNLDKKPKVKRELIYSYDFKNIKNLPYIERNTNNELKEDSKSNENKTIDNNENEVKSGHILQLNSIKTKNTNKYLPISSNKNSKNKIYIKSKIQNKKNIKINLDVFEKKYDKNKPVSENKDIYKKGIYKTNTGKESVIDTHYLLYSDLTMGVPDNIKDSYKLFQKKKQKTPDNRKIEYLRTFGDISD